MSNMSFMLIWWNPHSRLRFSKPLKQGYPRHLFCAIMMHICIAKCEWCSMD